MGKFSKNLTNRVRVWGPKKGYCVICGEYGKLSRDHVPPRKCNNISDMVLRQFHGVQDSVISQGGTAFRTLCKTCNSERLGAEYDPSLVSLSNEITSLAESARDRNIVIPPVHYSFVYPQKIARAIVGHVLAAVAVDQVSLGVNSAPMPDSLRNYFLDPNLDMPEKLSMYYWVYPYRKQVVIKGAAKSSMRSKNYILGHIIKFLPLGFWLVWDKPASCDIRLHELVLDKGMKINDMRQIPIDLTNIQHQDFPEAPASHEMLFMNIENSSVAFPRD